jgi:transposase
MPRPYSNDLRARVIEAIEAGASCREVAERYELSASVVVLWAQRFEQTGSFAAKPSGGSTSPLEEHADFLLTLIVKQPDLTLGFRAANSWRTQLERSAERYLKMIRAAVDGSSARQPSDGRMTQNITPLF